MMLHSGKIEHRDKFPNILLLLHFKGEPVRSLEKCGNVGLARQWMIVFRYSVERLEHEGNFSRR